MVKSTDTNVSHSTQKGLRWTCLHYSGGGGGGGGIIICDSQYFMNFCFSHFIIDIHTVCFVISCFHLFTAFKRGYSIGENKLAINTNVCAYEMNCFFTKQIAQQSKQ